MGTLAHGKSGSITWGGTGGVVEATVVKWQIDCTADVAEATSMADATWKVFLPNLLDWTATIDTIWNGTAESITDIGDDDSGVYHDLELEMIDGGAGLHGNAICTGVTHKVIATDVVKFTYTFQGSGELAYA